MQLQTHAPISSALLVEDWGLTPYLTALSRQLELVEQVGQGAPQRLVFCSHPSVVTLGRASTREDVSGWSGDVADTNRGGRATYHGPNQLVVYPIINLSQRRDVAKFLRELEHLVMDSLNALGLKTQTKTSSGDDDKSFTGVWVGEQKIASIGIAVKKWVTHHGVAINLRPDPLAFKGIQPCGFKPSIMTDLETQLGQAVDVELLKRAIVSFCRW